MTDAPAELRAWLTRDGHGPVGGWAPEPPLDELHCHPDLIARLTAAARSVGAVDRVFVGGCPVIHHRLGQPIAAAAGTAWFTVRSARPAGSLTTPEPRPSGLDTRWTMLDPWAPDVALSRTLDLLRGHLASANELAERAA